MDAIVESDPYSVEAPPLPQTLGEAVDALDASDVYPAAFGDSLVDYLVMMKRSETEAHAERRRWERIGDGRVRRDVLTRRISSACPSDLWALAAHQVAVPLNAGGLVRFVVTVRRDHGRRRRSISQLVADVSVVTRRR
jgi:hypothetical protein